MALYSPILSGKIRGSIGNTTFRKQRGRYGAVAYERIDGFKPDQATTIVKPNKGAWLYVAHAFTAIALMARLGGFKNTLGTAVNALFGAFVRSLATVWSNKLEGFGKTVAVARATIDSYMAGFSNPLIGLLDVLSSAGAPLGFKVSSGSPSLASVTASGTLEAPSVTVTSPFNGGADVTIDVLDVASGNVTSFSGVVGTAIVVTTAVTAVTDVKSELRNKKVAVVFVRVGGKRAGLTFGDSLLTWASA